MTLNIVGYIKDMDFIEISTPKALYGLLTKQIEDTKNKLGVTTLAECERMQLLGEHKALTQLLLEWLKAAAKVD